MNPKSLPHALFALTGLALWLATTRFGLAQHDIPASSNAPIQPI